MNGDEQGRDVSFELIIVDANVRGGFITEHQLSLPVFEMDSTDEVDVDERIDNAVESRFEISGVSGFNEPLRDLRLEVQRKYLLAGEHRHDSGDGIGGPEVRQSSGKERSVQSESE